jgi:hypothetical protein
MLGVQEDATHDLSWKPTERREIVVLLLRGDELGCRDVIQFGCNCESEIESQNGLGYGERSRGLKTDESLEIYTVVLSAAEGSALQPAGLERVVVVKVEKLWVLLLCLYTTTTFRLCLGCIPDVSSCIYDVLDSRSTLRSRQMQ